MNVKKTAIVIVLITAAAFHLSGKGLTAHAARIDITPPVGMKYTLGGYGERMNKPAESIHDRIFAKAIVFKNGNKKYAIITLDILALPSNVKSDLVMRLSGAGWGMENLMLLPSHSHGSLEMAALNSKNLLNNPQIGIFQPELLEFLLNKITILIKDADRDYQTVKIATQSKFIKGLNRNRRNDPEIDNELTVTRIDCTDGRPLAVLVNWTAHPTFLDSEDMMVSAEWPGYLQNELEKLIGNNINVLYYNGAEGDQSPVFDNNMNRYEKAEAYGRLMGQKSFELYRMIIPEVVNEFYSTYNTIRLPEQKAHPSFMKTGGAEYGLDESSIKSVMKMLGPSEVGLGAIRLGKLIIAGVPGEMTAVLGLQLKTELKKGDIKYVTVGGLANEWISYILSIDQYMHGEGYESSVSFYGPDLGSYIRGAIVKSALPLTDSK